MKPAVIIPTYDSLDTLKVLIHQLKDFDVYVIEDGQKKETIDWLRTQKQLKVILNDRNYGVTYSWNIGLNLAIQEGYRYFAFFNDDIEVPSNWWDICREKLANSNMIILNAPCPIPITGWFFIIDSTCVNRIGAFDEDMRMFGSDWDYWLRFKKSGLKVARVDIDVRHHGSKTVNKLPKSIFKEKWNVDWNVLKKKHKRVRFQEQLK